MHNVYISGRFPIKSLIFLYHIYLENTTGSKFSHNFLHLNFFFMSYTFLETVKIFLPSIFVRKWNILWAWNSTEPNGKQILKKGAGSHLLSANPYNMLT